MHAQSLWLRILTRVDDYGRYDARPSVLSGELFSVWNEIHPEDAVTPQRIPALSCELQNNELADFYEINGKKYVQLLQWQERVRENAKEKWPGNPNPLRNPAESCGILPPSPSPSPSPSPTPSPSSSVAPKPMAEPVRAVVNHVKTPEAVAGALTTFKALEERLNCLYKRPPTAAWTYAEQSALAEISRRPDAATELDHILQLRRSMPSDDRKRFFPQSIGRLLEKWNDCLDKAHVQLAPKRKAITTTAPKPAMSPEAKEAAWAKAKPEILKSVA